MYNMKVWLWGIKVLNSMKCDFKGLKKWETEERLSRKLQQKYECEKESIRKKGNFAQSNKSQVTPEAGKL